MRFVRRSVSALIVAAALVAVTATAAAGVEVLSRVEIVDTVPAGNGYVALTLSHNVPAGSYVTAVSYIGGIPVVSDLQPVDPISGLAPATFWSNSPLNIVQVSDSTGTVLSTTGGYGSITEFD